MSDHHKAMDDLRWASDFDRKDPNLGWRWDDLSSGVITRRHMMRLAIASGALYALRPLFQPEEAFAQAGAPGGEFEGRLESQGVHHA